MVLGVYLIIIKLNTVKLYANLYDADTERCEDHYLKVIKSISWLLLPLQTSFVIAFGILLVSARLQVCTNF